MREIVIVVADFYLHAERGSNIASGVTLPGLERVARFGTRSVLEQGWRAWVAEWLGRAELAERGIAGVAAAAAPDDALGSEQPVWLATPVHLVAGLRNVQMHPRGLLRMREAEQRRLAEDFERSFGVSGYRLLPLDCGSFLLTGLEASGSAAADPARWLGSSVESGVVGAPVPTAVRKLGAELEMWLHDHPVNVERSARRELPVTTLWLWGAGRASRAAANDARQPVAGDLAFGCDAWLEGVCRLAGGGVRPVPARLEDLLRYAADRAVLVMELSQLAASSRTDPLETAWQPLDRDWIGPAVAQLSGGSLARVGVIANDRLLQLRARDRLKRWRRSQPGLAALQ